MSMTKWTRQVASDRSGGQSDDARKMIDITNSVPGSRRGSVTAIVSAYIDGGTAGGAMAVFAGGAG